MEINGKTELYGVIGNPVKHSLSPVFQNVGFKSLGINAVYLPFEVPKESFEETVKGLLEQKDIKNSLDDYQKLIKLNNIIEKKFQRKSKSISQNMKEKIENITKKKNVKRSK